MQEMRGNLSSASEGQPSNLDSQNVDASFVRHDSDDARVVHQIGDPTWKDYIADIIMINTGEDLLERILSYFQGAGRCGLIVSAIGYIESPNLNHQGTVVLYEGTYVITTLSGLFLHGSDGRVNQLNAHAAFADSSGNLFGGAVVGPLVATTPIQVIVGSFIRDEANNRN